MKNNGRSILRIFLLFAFVYLMLCPYAEMLSAAHGGKILIQQDDFRKTKKLVKNDFQLDEDPVFLSSQFQFIIPPPLKKNQQAVDLSHHSIGLFIFSSVQLLL